MPYVSGFLRVREGGGNIDNELPGHEGPVDPGYGIDLGHGIDNSLPEPPVRYMAASIVWSSDRPHY